MASAAGLGFAPAVTLHFAPVLGGSSSVPAVWPDVVGDTALVPDSLGSHTMQGSSIAFGGEPCE